MINFNLNFNLKLIIFILFLVGTPKDSLAAEDNPTSTPSQSQSQSQGQSIINTKDSLPTYISSNSVTLKSEERVFVYTGNVKVTHGDMILTSDTLEGKYSEKNEIEQLVAKTNVVIVKGENIRGSSEKAVYDKATETMVLSENPEMQQEGSILSADSIKIFLNEDRSVAEGEVRVKVVNKDPQSPEGPRTLLKK